MGELVDWHALLVTEPRERERALDAAASTKRQAAARRARGGLLKGSTAAQTDLRRRWAAVTPRPRLVDLLASVTVYAGDGPPPVPVPENTPLGAWYLDRLTDILYRLGA